MAALRQSTIPLIYDLALSEKNDLLRIVYTFRRFLQWLFASDRLPVGGEDAAVV